MEYQFRYYSREYDNLIRPVMMAAKLISIWPLERNHRASATLFRICHSFWLFFLFVTMCVAVTADVVYNFDDLDKMTECALICFAFYLTVIRLVVYLLHHKDMQYVVEIMREDWTWSTYEDKIVLKEKCLFAFRLAKYFITMVAGTIITFSCIPILETYFLGTERILPFRGHFFINQTVSPVYECLYVFNIMAGWFGGGMIAGATSFNFVAIIHGSAKFALVRKKLEAIKSDDPDVKTVVAECVKRHHDAITYADALERIINILALGQFVISTGLVCFAGFQITSMMKDKARLMKYSAFLNSAILELFMFSFSGNRLIDESDAVGESAYRSDWVGGTFGRSLQIVMMRSKVSNKITAAKFYSMSLESFSQVLGTSFSYMMVLTAMKEE